MFGISRFFSKSKDGGSLSNVDGYFLIEIKSLFTIVVLKFNEGSREQYHSHAFNALTWFISGDMTEYKVSGDTYNYRRSLIPKITKRSNCHKVYSKSNSWAVSIRGPWLKYWNEYDQESNISTTLTNGRVIVNKEVGYNG